MSTPADIPTVSALVPLAEGDASALAGWLLVALAAACAGLLAASLVALRRLHGAVVGSLSALERQAARLDRLDELTDRVGELAEREGAAAAAQGSLARVEALLSAIRDRQGAVDEELVRALEEATRLREDLLVPAPAPPPPAPAPPTVSLAERVTNRLLAMGYERVQIVTDADLLDGIGAGDGEVLVEAKRQGALHKGRVRVKDGRISDVDLQPTYSIFP